MLHACVERFDVMCVRGNILGWEGEVNEASVNMPCESSRAAGVRTYPTTVPYVQPAVMTKINSKTRTYPVLPFEKRTF
jgi:hypothetical protein